MKSNFYTYTLLVYLSLSVFLSVCMYLINVITPEPIGPKFCVGPRMTPGKVKGCLKLYKLVSKSFFDFWKILKMRKKNIMKSANLFIIVLILFN